MDSSAKASHFAAHLHEFLVIMYAGGSFQQDYNTHTHDDEKEEKK